MMGIPKNNCDSVTVTAPQPPNPRKRLIVKKERSYKISSRILHLQSYN